MTYVFLNGVLIKDSSVFPIGKLDVPIGAYLLSEGQWYLKMKVSLVPLNLCDVPKALKTYCLIGGIKT